MNAPERIASSAGTTEREADGQSDLQRLLLQRAYSPRDDLLGDKFARMMDIAKVMADSGVAVQKHLRGNVGACFAVVQQALRWNADPWAVALKTHVVNELVAYESQLIGAVLNASGAIKEAALVDEYFGPWERIIGNVVTKDSKYKEPDGSAKTYRKLASTVEDEKGVGIIVKGTLVGEDQPRVLTLLITQASVRNSTLWADDPQQQLFYLAQKRWARKYAPGVILGLYSPDEIGSEVEDDDQHAPPPPPKGPQRRITTAAPKPAPAPASPSSSPATGHADPATGEVPPPAAGPAAAAPPASSDTRPLIGTGQVSWLKGKIVAGLAIEAEILQRYDVNSLLSLNVDAFDQIKSEIVAKG